MLIFIHELVVLGATCRKEVPAENGFIFVYFFVGFSCISGCCYIAKACWTLEKLEINKTGEWGQVRLNIRQTCPNLLLRMKSKGNGGTFIHIALFDMLVNMVITAINNLCALKKGLLKSCYLLLLKSCKNSNQSLPCGLHCKNQRHNSTSLPVHSLALLCMALNSCVSSQQHALCCQIIGKWKRKLCQFITAAINWDHWPGSKGQGNKDRSSKSCISDNVRGHTCKHWDGLLISCLVFTGICFHNEMYGELTYLQYVMLGQI